MIDEFISPLIVLKQIVEAIPQSCQENIIIVGSLAAAFHFSDENLPHLVRTKDVDCLIAPRIHAVSRGQDVANKLMASGWMLRTQGDFVKPGNEKTPDAQLPSVRLYPPGENKWFLELLTVPEKSNARERRFLRIKTSLGDFGLPSFGFLTLAEFKPLKTEFGIHVATPEMMALANLLEHPLIRPDTMSGLIADRRIKRSNKDLGRVLALARLSDEKVEFWSPSWINALQYCFHSEWETLAMNAGAGLRALLISPPDMDEAVHTCNISLLARQPVDSSQLELTGRRFIQDVIEPLEKVARHAIHLTVAENVMRQDKDILGQLS